MQLRLELGTSPYRARLALAGERAALLTSDALYWLDSGAPGAVHFPMGDVGVPAESAVVRWASGALWRWDYHGREWSTLARLADAPRMLTASGERVAWLQGDAFTGGSIWTLMGSEPRRLATAPLGIATITLRDDRVFFVEELPGRQWRLGVKATSDEPPSYTAPWSGRPPAALTVTSEVFFYDGPTSSVYRTSTDLRRTERVAKDVVCSPLAVATSVYCAQPGAVLELPLSGGQLRLLSPPKGTITALVATRSELIWLREARDGGLAVEALGR